jgi:hypothetical protein
MELIPKRNVILPWDLVTLTITTPATAINGGNVPTIDPTTGTVVVPQYACRKLYYTKSVIT